MSDAIEFTIVDESTGIEYDFMATDGDTVATGIPSPWREAVLATGYPNDEPLAHLDEFIVPNHPLSTVCKLQANPTPTPEVYDMSKPVIEQKTLFRGMDVARMDEYELVNTLRSVEDEIESLKSIKTESTAIATQIDKLNGALAVIAKALDAKA